MSYIDINTNNTNTNPNNGGNNGNNGNMQAIPNGNGNMTMVQQGPTIPETLIDYSKLAADQKLHAVQFRDSIIQRLLTTLTTTNHPNALLVGDAGTGKTAIVEALALKLYEKDPLVTGMLGDETKIYELPLNNIISGSSMMGAAEAKIQAVLNFAQDPSNHAILYFDEIHQLITNSALKNIAELIKPALSRGDIHVIGSTTTQELKFWQRNPALTRRFSNIIVNELTNEQTIEVLSAITPKLQRPNQLVTVDPALFEQVVQVGNQYAKSLNTHRPDSAITILDQSMSQARLQSLELKQNAQLNVSPKINRAIIEKAGQQLVNADNNQINDQVINEIEQRFDEKIVGQDNAKKTIINALKSINLNLTPQTKPHSFLFAGLSGTGKTEIAKQLARGLFKDDSHYLYLNMTEYTDHTAVNSLIGSARGYVGSNSAQPLPLDGLKTNPYQIVVLDEFEKADSHVQKLFMQALDEGFLRYADQSIVDFSQAIVIATTNAGTKNLDTPHVGFNPKQTTTENDLIKVLKDSFPIELLNRFEHVVQFTSISKDQYQAVLAIKYDQLVDDIQKYHPEYQFTPQTASPDDDFIQKLTDETYHALQNGRPAQKAIRNLIESKINVDPKQYKISF